MRITKVKIQKNFPPDNGLDEIDMDCLGQVVLIAGRNGSGKSRLLEKIGTAFNCQPRPQQEIQLRSFLKSHNEALKNFKDELSRLVDVKNYVSLVDVEKVARINQCKMQIEHFEREIKNNNQELDKIVLNIDSDSEYRNIVHFVPKKLDLRDPKELLDNDREERARGTHSLGVVNMHENALSKIQDLHNQYWNATHQNSQLGESERVEICKEYNLLQTNIDGLLGEKLGNDSRGTATIFGLPIGQSKLSDGQKVLLQLAVAIHCQGSQLSKIVLLLDEPENHLHPAAIIEILEILIEKIPDGQIWVATHSVSLLAHFSEIGSLWYMDGGRISPAGKIQEKVLQGLLGDETRISRQRDFLDKPEKIALTRYAQQCLCPPSAVMTGSGDPQIGQIRKAIEDSYQKHGQLKILDYGAGQGRLLANLGEDIVSPEEILTKVNYIAYDESSDCKSICKTQIKKIYDSSENRWFGSY